MEHPPGDADRGDDDDADRQPYEGAVGADVV
jgi:hypothetical protein